MASPQYVPRLEMLTVGALINLIKTIELNPIYQRKIVWTDEMMAHFIDSVYKGIIPTNIIFKN